MQNRTVRELVSASKLHTSDAINSFHRFRKEAFAVAHKVYGERAASYNVDHEPTEEMVYGVLSLASEIHKRSIRMAGLLSPEHGLDALTPLDQSRLLDTCIDLMQYASWQYALLKIACGEEAEPLPDTTDFLDGAPNYGEFADFSGRVVRPGPLENHGYGKDG